jgi:hypothetical protein
MRDTVGDTANGANPSRVGRRSRRSRTRLNLRLESGKRKDTVTLMPKFMLVYKGEATDMSEMTPEQGAEVIAK